MHFKSHLEVAELNARDYFEVTSSNFNLKLQLYNYLIYW